jgi:ketosteroid isomerase-like protein
MTAADAIAWPAAAAQSCEAAEWGTAMPDTATSGSDLEVLTSLNRDYIRSVQNGDVRRFDEILAADFRCSNPDGSLVDRSGFLAQTARPVTISNLAAHDVEIRMFGDIAIIHARTSYTMADGRPGAGRYTDVWARQNGEWRAVSAHVTRC